MKICLRAALVFVGITLLSGSVSAQTVTVWFEPFNYPNGTMNVPPVWTTTYTDVDDSGINAGGNYWGVATGEFRCNDIEGANQSCQNFLTTQAFNIQCLSNVTVSFDARFTGVLECGGGASSNDEILAFYSINSGPWVQYATICGPNNLPNNFSVNGLSGNTIALRFQIGNKSNDENYFIDNILIEGTPLATANAGADQLYCTGTPVQLNGSGGGSYQWSPANGLSCTNCASPMASPSANTTYILTVSNGNCSDQDTVVVSVAQTPSANLGADIFTCASPFSQMLDAGNPGSTYQWSTGAQTQQLNITTGGTYWVNVNNICGNATDTIQVFTGVGPSVNLGDDQSFCLGNVQVSLNAGNPGSSYLWSNGAQTQQINVNTSGTYWVNVLNNCGQASDTIVIFEITQPSVNLGPDTMVCGNFQLALHAGNPNSAYQWSTGESTQSIQVGAPGYYSVSVNTGCGIAQDTIYVSQAFFPVAQMEEVVPPCGEKTAELNAGNYGAVFSWSTGETTQIIHVDTSGYYWVDITSCGQTLRDSVLVRFIEPGTNQLFLPSAFTPNEDGLNDGYQAGGIFESLKNFRAEIFNRWGESIFSSDNPYFFWDGTFQGSECPPGVYVIRVRFEGSCSVENPVITQIEKIQLIR